MTRAWGRGAWVCLVLAVMTSRAWTAPARSTARLYYQKSGASACPEVEAVRTAIADRMGYDPFVEAAPIIVLVAITMDPDQLRRARVSIIDENGKEYGQREVTSAAPTCDELASMVALVISVAIPAATERQLEAQHAAELEALKKRSYVPLPAAATESTTAVPVEEHAVFRLLVGGRASVGSVPGMISPGLTIGFGVQREAFSAEADLVVDYARTQHIGDGSLDASLYRGALLLCRHGGRFALCGMAAGGAIHAEGHGFTANNNVTNPYVSLGARLGYERVLTKGFVALAYLDVESAIETTSLNITGEMGWKWVAPGAALAGGLALGSRFP